jgi:hypothetical protein
MRSEPDLCKSSTLHLIEEKRMVKKAEEQPVWEKTNQTMWGGGFKISSQML